MKHLYTFILSLLFITSNAATFTVTTGTDGLATDVGRMRWAITQANAAPGSTINIGGVFTGAIQGVMPVITGNGTIINGWSRPDQSPNTAPIGSPSNAVYVMQLQDPGATASNGLYIMASNCIVQGICVNGYGNSASVVDFSIRIQGNNNIVRGCMIGLNTNGTTMQGSRTEYGIGIVSGTGNQIGDGTPAGLNVISYNPYYNVFVNSGTSGTIIRGNYIGTTMNLTEYNNAAWTDQDYGIYCETGGTGTIIGGTVAGQQNYIAYNDINGIRMLGAATTATIRRNLIYNNNPVLTSSISINLSGVANSGSLSPYSMTASVNGVKGSANPNDIIEVYKNTTGGVNCEDLNIYLGTVTTTAGGAWILMTPLALGDRVVATATNSINTKTSEVSMCALVTLPIELLSFNVTLTNSNAIINWSTGSEINNDYFTVEQSIDAINFKPIITIPSKGNSSVKQDYQTIDYEPTKGTSYYRLKQTDFDGQFTYSKTIAIDFKTNSLYAYKTSNGYLINYTATDKASIEIYTTLGQSIFKENFTGTYNKEVVLSTKEVYIVTIITKEKTLIKKIF